jgi:hypothetical protein
MAHALRRNRCQLQAGKQSGWVFWGVVQMRSALIGLAALAVASAMSLASAGATTVVAANCTSVTDTHGCLFSGNINTNTNGNASYLLAQGAYNTFNDTHPSAQPDITLTPITDTSNGDFSDFGSFTGAGTSSGTWSLPGFDVDFVAVKAGDFFVLYELASAASSGSWSTADIHVGNSPNAPDLSHLVFFGTPAGGAPEPSVWLMLIAGFGLMGAAVRSRNTLVKA